MVVIVDMLTVTEIITLIITISIIMMIGIVIVIIMMMIGIVIVLIIKTISSQSIATTYMYKNFFHFAKFLDAKQYFL